MTRIVVTTPTGNVGSAVTSSLVRAGVRPTVLVRDPARLPAALRERVDVVVGDQGDVDAVLAATAGADALFWVDPPTGDADPVEGHARLGAVAARAVEAGVGHTVFLSSGGAEKRGGAGEIDGLARTELLLDEAAAASGRAVLHLRCGYFFSNLLFDLDGLLEGVLRTAWPLELAQPWVDPRDIAGVAVARLLARNWSGRAVVGVHGPEDLTFADVAEIITTATGRPVRAERISDDDVRAALRAAGLGPEQVEGVVGMAAGLREGFVPEQPRDVTTTTPTSLAAWAHARLRPLLAAP